MTGYLVASVSAGALLLIATAAAWRGFRAAEVRRSRGQLAAVGAALVAQTVGIGFYCAGTSVHFFSGPGEVCALLAWAINCAHFLTLLTTPVRGLGLLLAPLSAVLLLPANLLKLPGYTPVGDVTSEPLFVAHVLIAFLAYGVLTAAFGAAALYLTQERLLKRKLFGALFRGLPSLERLDRAVGRCAAVGFVLFGAAILCGALLVRHLNPPPVGWWLEPKILTAELSWLLLGGVLLSRTFGRVGARAGAKLLLVGAVVVMLTFVLTHPFRRAESAAGKKDTPPPASSSSSSSSSSPSSSTVAVPVAHAAPILFDENVAVVRFWEARSEDDA